MNIFLKSPVVIFFTVYLVLSLLYYAYLWTLPTHTTIWNYLVNCVYGALFIFGGGYGIYHAFKSGISSSIGKALFLIGLGITMWGIGLNTWAYYNLVLNVPVPYPSWVDPLLLSFYFLVGTGIIILIKLFRPSITSRVALESLLIGIVAAAVIIFVMRPDLSESLPLVVKILNVMYPLGNAILVALVLVIMRVGGGSIRNSFPLFLVGLVLHALGSFLYGYTITNGTYWNGNVVDLTVTVAVYFLSIGLAKIVYDYNAKPAQVK